MKRKYPVGTKIIREHNSGEVLAITREGYIIKWSHGVRLWRHSFHYIENRIKVDKIIIPHGYNTPLWRTLNGET